MFRYRQSCQPWWGTFLLATSKQCLRERSERELYRAEYWAFERDLWLGVTIFLQNTTLSNTKPNGSLLIPTIESIRGDKMYLVSMYCCKASSVRSIKPKPPRRAGRERLERMKLLTALWPVRVGISLNLKQFSSRWTSPLTLGVVRKRYTCRLFVEEPMCKCAVY